MEGESRDGYRDQIVSCDVGVSLHSGARGWVYRGRGALCGSSSIALSEERQGIEKSLLVS